MISENIKIAVVGLGYVGLPLALEFSKKYPVLGFDIKKERIIELSLGQDSTKEADIEELNGAINNGKLRFSEDITALKEYNVYIVTVPTPINQFKAPDLGPLIGASKMLGSVLKKRRYCKSMNLRYIPDVRKKIAFLYWKSTQGLHSI